MCMPIVQKSVANMHLKRLDERVLELKSVLQGNEPNDGLWNFYSLNESDYSRDFTEISATDLSYALSDLEAVIKELKKVRTLKAKRLHTTN